MALVRFSTSQPLFYCADCRSRPAQLRDNDSLGDPLDLIIAHRNATGHKPILVGGHGYICYVNPKQVNCVTCLDEMYLATRSSVFICSCTERSQLVPARRRANKSTKLFIE